jgi:hypothetical protein
MEPLQTRIYQLVLEACSHPPGSRERQQNLTKIIRLIDRHLWRESTIYYEDALQKTWIYFCQNICEGKTGQPYDPDRASVITWLNNYLKRKLQDYYLETQKRQAKIVDNQLKSLDESKKKVDFIDNIPAKTQIFPLLEDVRRWVETDPTKKLRRIYIENRPEITCQLLILRRLPPPTPWKIIAEELNISPKTLSSFYHRQCLPLLQEFGHSAGYL